MVIQVSNLHPCGNINIFKPFAKYWEALCRFCCGIAAYTNSARLTDS